MVLGTARLAAAFRMEMRQVKDKRGYARELCRMAMTLGTLVPCSLLAYNFGFNFFPYLPFAAFCLYGVRTERVVRAFTACVGTMLAVTVLSALSGGIQNLIYIRGAKEGAVRGAYGVCYPTDFASYLVYLLLFFRCIQRKRGWWSLLPVLGLALIFALLADRYADSRTSAFLALLTAAAVLAEEGWEALSRRGKGNGWASKTAETLMVWAFPLMALAVGVLIWMYGQGNGLASTVNEMMSQRLRQSWDALNKYGVHAFGAPTPQKGRGNYLIFTGSSYEFLDSSYVLLLIRYGWVIFLIAAGLWVWMTRRAIRRGNRRLALVMALIAVHSFSEHHFPELNFNVLLAAPFCVFAAEDSGAAALKGRRHQWAGWAVGVPMAAIFLILLPRLLSWARALFDLKGWMGGEEMGIYPLFCWLGFLLALGGLWLLLRQVILRFGESRKLPWPEMAGAAVLILALAGGALSLNGMIDGSLPDFAARIETDRAPVELILREAAEPVYAGQKEEVYKRSFQGLSDRVFSPEELARTGKGSVLLDHDQEGNQLLKKGALYAELSPNTGLFTFDSRLADALRTEGWRLTDYYSAERSVNLAAFAEMNGLEETDQGGLKLEGRKHSLIHGPYLEQFEGDYTVTFTLRLTEEVRPEPGTEVCLLRTAALFGKDIREERTLLAEDFPEEGVLTYSIDYHVPDTRGVEFLVFARDEIRMQVDRITWIQRNPAKTGE